VNQQYRHLVIHAPNWLGDVIMAQPAIRAFATGLKAQRVFLSGQPWLADVLPWLNLAGVEYLPEGENSGDACVLFPNSFSSAWRARQSGCKRRIGYRGQWRSLLLTDALTPRISMLTGHHREYYNDLATQMGIRLVSQHVHLVSPDKAIALGEQMIMAHGLDVGRTLCIAPGAQFGGAKRYPAESWAKVAHILSARGYDILALGTPAERDIAAQVLAACDGPTYNSAGDTSLSECLQILRASRGLLCNDSGLMHVAAGMGKSVVAVFGATDPERTAPSGGQVHLLYQPAHCSPCLQRECRVEGQPCMANIFPEQVAEACLEELP